MTAPNAIANLGFWVKGDAGGPYQDSGTSTLCLSAGDLVQHWLDQSGNSNDVSQSTSASRPQYQPLAADSINGIPTVRFPTINSAISLNIANLAPSGNALTAFFLTRAGVEALYLHGPFGFTGLNVEFQKGRPALFFTTGGSVNPTLYIPIRPMVWGFVSNGSQVVVYVDRATYTLAGTFGGSLTSGVIGVNGAGNTKMDVAEMAVYTRALTATEISGLLTYFEGRGNIAAASTKTKLLAFDGDSLTAGSDTASESTSIPNNYPSQLYGFLDSTWEAYNFGTGGSIASTLTTNRPTVIDPLLNPIQYLSSTLIIWVGTNDLQNSTSPATIWSSIQTYISGAKTAGWGRVGVLTILPNVGGATIEANRQTLNGLIRNGYTAAGADFLVDVGADPLIGVAGANTNPLWYTSDNTHMTTAGYNRVAQLVLSPVGGPSAVQNLTWNSFPPVRQTIRVFQGTDQMLNFTPSTGTPNITGWNIQLTVKQKYGATTALLTKSGNSVVLNSPLTGGYQITLLSADTNTTLGPGDYVYDISRTDSGANDCLAYGVFTVQREARL